MSARRKQKQPRLRHSSNKKQAGDEDMPQPRQPMAVTSGLNAIHIAPRTPKTPRTPWTGRDDSDDTTEVELSLLGEDERRQAALGLGETEEQGYPSESELKRPLSNKDKRGMVLLVILCEPEALIVSHGVIN